MFWATKWVSKNLKEIQVTESMFSDRNGLKLEINNRKISGKCLSVWKLNNILLYDPWVKEEIKREIKLVSILNWMKKNIPYIKVCGIPLK